jgi:hypothetical protein
MGKQSIKETRVNAHVLSATGILSISDVGAVLETEDVGEVALTDLLKNFSGEPVTIKVVTKEEE